MPVLDVKEKFHLYCIAKMHFSLLGSQSSVYMHENIKIYTYKYVFSISYNYLLS